MKVAKYFKALVGSLGIAAASTFAPSVLDKALEHVGVDVVAEAHAQAKKKVIRKLPGLNERTLKKLGEVSALVSPDTEKNPNAKPDFQKALSTLKGMEKSCNRTECNDNERAQIYKFYAYIYFQMDNYPKALSEYKRIYKLSPNITVALELTALNALSQLSGAEENYKDALKYLDLWMKLSTVVGADKFFLRCKYNYADGNVNSALKDCKKAITQIEQKNKVPKEQWYELLVGLYFQKEDVKSARPYVEKLIRHYGKAKWWGQYSYVQSTIGNESKTLGSLDAMYVQKGLSRNDQYVNIASYYLNKEVPYKAAKVLQQGFDAKVVRPKLSNYKLLANAWRAAKETKRAIKAQEKVATVAKKEDASNKGKKGYKPEEGNALAALVALHSRVENHKSAVEVGKKALKAGNLKKPCEVHTNMGIAYVELKKFKSAISSFEKARKDKQCRAFVNNWIKYTKNEEKQYEVLKEFL